MTFHVFVTTPRAGLGFAVAPFTVECKEVWDTAAEAQAFADAKTLSPGVLALFDAMPSLFPAFVAGTVEAPVVYALGERRAHAGKTWQANLTHSNAGDPGWAPGAAGNLWTLVPNPGAAQWVYPASYPAGSRCVNLGEAYTLIQPHTSQAGWAPALVPSLWHHDGPDSLVSPYSRARWDVVSSDSPDYVEINRAKEPA